MVDESIVVGVDLGGWISLGVTDCIRFASVGSLVVKLYGYGVMW